MNAPQIVTEPDGSQWIPLEAYQALAKLKSDDARNINPAYSDAGMYSFLSEAVDEWGCKHDHPEINKEVADIMRKIMAVKPHE